MEAKERKSSDAHIRAAMKYRKEKTVLKQLNFNKNTDADILEHLDSIDNFQGYIKRLIRKDISADTSRVFVGASFCEEGVKWIVTRMTGPDALVESEDGKRIAVKVKHIEDILKKE